MNKNILKICFVIALTMCAASAYGASTLSSSIAIGGGSYSPSNKVSLTVAATATDYTANSKHQAGDRVIQTNNREPKMWWKTVTISTAVQTQATTTDVLDTNNWTSL